MPIVNYVREHVRFIEYASEENLSSSEMLLWYALMHQMNQRAQGNIWPEEFVRIDNDRLLSYLPFGYDALAEARNKLKQRGVIDYVPGERNKKNPTYKVNYFYPQYVKPETEEDSWRKEFSRRFAGGTEREGEESYPEKTDKNSFYPEKPDNKPGKTGVYPENPVNSPSKVPGNMPGNMGGNMPGNPANININLDYKEYRNSKPEKREEDDDEEDDVLLRAREAEAGISWKSWTGETATPALKRRLATVAVMAGFEDGVLNMAIELAASRGKYPMSYVFTILADWMQAGIIKVSEAEEYQALKDAAAENGYDSEAGEELRSWKEMKRKNGSSPYWK